MRVIQEGRKPRTAFHAVAGRFALTRYQATMLTGVMVGFALLSSVSVSVSAAVSAASFVSHTDQRSAQDLSKGKGHQYSAGNLAEVRPSVSATPSRQLTGVFSDRTLSVSRCGIRSSL